MAGRVDWRWALLSALLFALIPLGPPLETDRAEMECLKPNHFRMSYADMSTCNTALKTVEMAACICRNASSTWARIYYFW